MKKPKNHIFRGPNSKNSPFSLCGVEKVLPQPQKIWFFKFYPESGGSKMGKTLFHGQNLDGLVHLACFHEFLRVLDVFSQNKIPCVNFG